MKVKLGATYFVFLMSLGYSQMSYSVSYHSGYFMQHSEYDNPITENEEFQFSNGLQGSITYPIARNKYIQLNFGLISSKLPLMDTFIISEVHNTSYQKEIGSLEEIAFPLDVRIFISEKGLTGYGCGITFSGINHSFKRKTPIGSRFEDTFNSTGLGLNGIVRFSYEISESTFLISDITVRYLKAIRFSGEGRDFSNYNHNTFQVTLAVGLGRIRK
ncbi:MAG: hypothetical protein HOA15_05915 [Candidatus Marinimicrobia bacterium]|jgi:hypothetical protein|nr:hypothetical protein [Candidatus Neomarinimicrobiota bacterium]MBT4808826.1 hypothetical protein [Candidatus Neomarinimicrobiota bacterium]MBT5760234.1 hypothetical protein [Candidatus Neomarinimicrobiota bacterium]MBT6391683.1 hypothetical protein [Candidatus Neomarinimicrobiota bacterium]MBT6841422.1 hypothetical protein [Candidatus Neomarinimicrobiota bacterium]